MPSFTTAQLAEYLDTRVEGDESLTITGLNSLEEARPEELSFVGDERHARIWLESHAGCIVVSAGLELPERSASSTILSVESADLAMIRLLELFSPPATEESAFIAPSAVIEEGAELGRNVWVGEHCRIRRGCVIGDGTRLEGGVDLYEDSHIGAHCVLHSGARIHARCRVGDHSIIHSNVVIGSDGFGYRPSEDGSSLVKTPHLGNVEIEAHVEIGAGTCIDRGKFGATRVGHGTKIDNLCQIGHNCQIGRLCVICGQVGIAGTTKIGDGTQIGGGSGLKDHLVIGRGVSIGARSGVMNDIPDGEIWYGVPAGERSRILREHAAIRRLPEWSKKIRKFLSDQGPD